MARPPWQRASKPEPEEVELAPRAKPEIPGADLEPDIVPEEEQFLDAEAQAPQPRPRPRRRRPGAG